ncbi:MAG: ABC transporter substrate-binding protein [Rhizobiaceae bacterium]|nr:ABC transporter substrate-binding protein [Rhizobiaceae bacterium]MBL4696165.1 ABC transporter substrate-binding protein [Rhizobiaceae bacterium]
MKRILALGTALALMAGAASAADKKLTISVYSFGTDAMTEAVFDPFEKVCGCEVVVETGRSVERMAKIEANASNPIIDVAVMSSHDALALARKGLLQSLDVSKIPSHADLYESAKDPIGDNFAIGYGFYATSIVYRSDLVEIDSWADLLSDKLKGRVALPNITGTQGPLTLHMLGEAMGGDDIKFTKTIDAVGAHAKDIVTFYGRSSALVQLMLQEEVIAAPIGRFAWSRFSGAKLPFKWAEPKEGQTGGMNVMLMTKGNGNEELAYQFMNYWLSTEVQTRVAEMKLDSPANAKVVVSDEIAESLTYGADLINSLKMLDPAAIIDNRDAWLKRWNEKVVN